MPLDPHALLARAFPEVRQDYTARDTLLYALGIGLGADPTDPRQLPFVYEGAEGRDLRALPSLANVLAAPGFWARDPAAGIDWRRLLHAEQWVRLHRPVPPEGSVRATTRLTAFHDKGAAKGALLASEREVVAADGPVATVGGLAMLRGDGGSGVTVGTLPGTRPVPDRAPDAACDLPTLPQAALIYRLSGDPNPLHADPAVAAAAGFPRPILHGLCTFGIAVHAALRTLLGYDAGAVAGMQVRFTAPVLPGQVLHTELWQENRSVAFRTWADGHLVLDRGRVDLR